MTHNDAEVKDLFIIGGGINGCGIARDAAGRGLSVTLAEMNDLASRMNNGAVEAFRLECSLPSLLTDGHMLRKKTPAAH